MNDRVNLFASWDRATQFACIASLKQKNTGRRMLTRSQVDEVVRLYRDERLGISRVSTLTGVNVHSVKKIVAGITYTDWTGGRIANGRREDVKWRGGSKTYIETISEEC